MCQRFTKAAKHNPGQIRQFVQAFQHSLERVHIHMGFGVVPHVADTGAAVKVAAGGWLDIQLSNIR